MCGICGIWSEQCDRTIRESAVRAMCDAQVHRGPNDSGILNRDRATLGMRRLSVIDLDSGQQPILNETRDVGIVFNGEIYNYRELHAELVDKGHSFTSRSDTETIVHAYEEWGDDCVHRLRGMFAFAILDWRDPSRIKDARDARRPRLFLARDRLGIKPLYWYDSGDAFLFSSEVRSLLASGMVPRRLSNDGVASYLAFGSVQEPLTLIADVYSLPPGRCMEVAAGRRRSWTYWDFPSADPSVTETGSESFNRTARRVREALTEAVRLHTRSDVPLGAFLSSGIDSSVIVALMATQSDVPVRTFTIAFEEEAFSEVAIARRTAARYDTDHEEILVRPAEVLAELPQAIAAMDQPSIDGINTFYVSRAARRAGMTVALSGLGGDEVFAGYRSFRTVPQLETAKRYLPPFAREALARIPFGSSDRARKIGDALSGRGDFDHAYFSVRALFTPRQRDALLSRHGLTQRDDPWGERVRARLSRAATLDPVNATSYLECTNYLPNTLLRDTDAMSMAHSLEVRVPLLDHVVVEQVFNLEGSLKLDRKIPKPLLVAATSDLLLPEVVNQEKRTFTFPWELWMKGELCPLIGSRLAASDGAMNEVVEPTAVADVWNQFLRGKTSWSRPWSLYVLASWIDLHLT